MGSTINTPFSTQFDANTGHAVAVAPGIVRVTAPNSGPMTFKGTNSYIIGEATLAVVDPGPADQTHFDALLAAIDGRPVSHILITHTHRDHTELVEPLQRATGAVTAGCAPHHSARALAVGEINHLDAAADRDYAPALIMSDGETLLIDGLVVTAITTPGHTANHVCFAVGHDGVVLSGDHIMAWATTVVAPPDGSMGDYLGSLDKMAKRADTLYLPGHGGPVAQPRAFVRALKTHRKMREGAIITCLEGGMNDIATLVETIYRDTDKRLHGAAALSVLAHLEHLIERGVVSADGPLDLASRYRLSGRISSASISD